MKLINKCWVDKNNNAWDASKYTKNDANKYSKSLINCHDCCNCEYCTGCYKCIDCVNCNYCQKCQDCKTCNHCEICNDCGYCHYCAWCIGCENCDSCRDCHSYIFNPQRYITGKIGSDNKQTVFYYGNTNDGKSLQVVWNGIWKGNLDEFERLVMWKCWNDKKYLNRYLAEIEKVKVLFGLEEKGNDQSCCISW